MPSPLPLTAASTALDLGGAALGALTRTAAARVPQDKAKATAQDFESMFLENALQQLSTATGSDGPLGDNGIGGGVYRSLLLKEYAGHLARKGGLGIADQVYRELLKLQEARHAG